MSLSNNEIQSLMDDIVEAAAEFTLKDYQIKVSRYGDRNGNYISYLDESAAALRDPTYAKLAALEDNYIRTVPAHLLLTCPP